MAKETLLTHIENNRGITKEEDGAFLFILQRCLLLHLRERGLLNEMQYRRAEEKLRHQMRIYTESGEGGR